MNHILRLKPSGVAARAIMRSGIGYKYWPFLAIEKNYFIAEEYKRFEDIKQICEEGS